MKPLTKILLAVAVSAALVVGYFLFIAWDNHQRMKGVTERPKPTAYGDHF